jgi:hypothetical protein
LAIHPSQHPAALRLAALSRQYHDLLDNHAQVSEKDLLHHLFTILAELYWAGLVLPAGLSPYLELVTPSQIRNSPPDNTPEPPSPAAITDQERDRIRRSLASRLGLKDSYHAIADPYELSENRSVSQSISDDAATVYRDLTEALMEWDRGEHMRAVVRWKNTFQARWGPRVLGALAALHCQARHYQLGWPNSDERDA